MSHAARIAIIALSALLAVTTAIACGDDEEGSAAGGEGEGEGEGETENVTAVESISECGGFDRTAQGLGIGQGLTIEDEGYCDAEQLYWEYDAATETLEIVNTRVEANCCATLSMSASMVEGTIELSETIIDDNPCDCMCVFDMNATLSGVRTGERTVVVSRGAEVFSGALNLADGSGVEVVSTTPAGMCGM